MQTINGEYVVVEWVRHEILEHSVEVYNFQVEINHNYYITSGILVHNSCNHDGKWNNERRSYWRREAKTVVEGYNYGPYQATAENIKRMRRGSAPIGWDGYSIELHHIDGIQNSFKDYIPVSRTLHMAIHTFF